MKIAELRTQSASELNKLVAEKRTDLAEARRSNAAGDLVNTRKIRELKREIAQLLTAQNEPKTQDVKENKS